MSTNANSSGSAGLGLPGVLAVVFVVLKLVGAIGWSWWWVLSPLWISAGAWVAVMLVVAAVALLNGKSGKARR